jgi:hypothetical protein
LVLGFLLLGNRKGPFVATFFTTEEIKPIIAVEDFKDVVYRKCFFTLHTWKSHWEKPPILQ